MIKNTKPVSQVTIYEKYNKKFVVDLYNTDDGKQIEWSYIHSPNSSIVVAVTQNNELVLIKQFRFNIGIYTFENPSGGSDNEESALDTAKRELLEETGYEAKSVVFLGRYYNMPTETNRWVSIFLTTNISKVKEASLDDQIEKYMDVSVELMPIDQAESIICGLEHLFAIQLAKKYLKI